MTVPSTVPIRESFLPFARPDFDDDEIREVTETLRSGWITTGPKTKQFEQEFAKAVGARHAIALSSCTAALHLALEAAGVGRGDEVITTPYTFAASAEVIRYFDAKPVLIDVEPESLNIRADLIEAAVTERTKAILPVHIAGVSADLDPIIDVARRHGLKVIEDAAHSFPTRYKGRMIGSAGDLTCFSFYATKTITTGEGGMITTNDDVAAALGLAQLRKAGRMFQRREAIARRFNAAFSSFEELQVPGCPAYSTHAWHLYMLRLNLDRLTIDRATFVKELHARKIGVSVHFIPLHVHPYYRDLYGYVPQDFPIAYREYLREISLPIYSTMSDDDVDSVIAAVRDVIAAQRP